MRAGKVLTEATARLEFCGIDEPMANAQWLLAAAMNKSRLDILAAPNTELSKKELALFSSYIKKKESGVPLAYILGTQDFIDVTLTVDSRVLIPRPETEELAQYAASFLHKNFPHASVINVLDYGAGSGAIGLWLLTKFPNMNLIAADKSKEALDCAYENAKKLNLTARVKFENTDTPAKILGVFNLIVSNPPYIPSGIISGLSPEVLSEPHMALDGGADGLSIARLILKHASNMLISGGGLFMELSAGDPQKLRAEAGAFWQNIEALEDFSGKKRFFKAIK